MHEPDPWAVAVIASLGDERARRALSARDIERMRLAGGRPLPPVLRATLQRRGPRWGMPGQWARGKPSSFQAARIDALVRRLVEKDDFHPQHHWDLAALAERLPGECHALDLDPPYAFLYVAEDAPRDDQADHPVFVLQLYDDVLEVVAEAPSLAAYFALRLGLVPAPRSVGGLLAHEQLGEPLRRAVARAGLALDDDGSRLYVAAPRAERATTTRKARTARAKLEPSSAAKELPDWVEELYRPYAAPAADAWALVRSSEDAALLAAFRAASAEREQSAVSATKGAHVRTRLFRVQHDSYAPHLALLFRLAVLLDAPRGAAVLRAALAASVADAYHAAAMRGELVAIAVRHRVLSADECRRELLTGLPSIGGDTRFGGEVHVLGPALATRDDLSDDEIAARAEALASGREAALGGAVHRAIPPFCLCALALLVRDGPRHAPRVHELASTLTETLVRGGERAQRPYLRDAMRAIERTAKARRSAKETTDRD